MEKSPLKFLKKKILMQQQENKTRRNFVKISQLNHWRICGRTFAKNAGKLKGFPDEVVDDFQKELSHKFQVEFS